MQNITIAAVSVRNEIGQSDVSIERMQHWVKQAKALAKGGEAEYVKVFGKKPR